MNQKIGEVEERIHIQPLTHCTREGKAYQRSVAVESKIESALALTPAYLVEFAKSPDHKSSDYVQEECLVYLIREYKRKDRNSVVNDLTRILLQRCAKFINNRLQILGQDTVEEAFHDVIQEMFTQILDLDSDRGDFLQVRFWAALKVIVISTFNRYKKRLEEAKNTVPLSSLAGYERTADDSNTRTFVPLEDLVDSSLSMEQRVLYQEGLNTLEDPYRTAFVLRHYYGWPIEASDPSVPSISHHFNRSSRTIRTWLSQAEEALERWRGENNETAQ